MIGHTLWTKWPRRFQRIADGREDLRDIRAPALVMVGDRDIIRLEHALELFRLIPTCRLAVLPGTDHGLRLTNPEWVASMIQDFLLNTSDPGHS